MSSQECAVYPVWSKVQLWGRVGSVELCTREEWKMKWVSSEFQTWPLHLLAVWPGQGNFPFSALAEVVFAAALGSDKPYILTRAHLKGMMFGTASQIIELPFFLFPLITVHFFGLTYTPLSQNLAMWVHCVPDLTQPLFLFSFGWNLLNASFYWRLETKLSHFSRDHKLRSQPKDCIHLKFCLYNVWIWTCHQCFLMEPLPSPRGLTDICFLTISAWFSLISVDAAVLSQSYLLAAFLSQTPQWWSEPSISPLLSDLIPGQTNTCLLKASRSETWYVICPLLIQGKPLIGTGQIFAGCPPCPWRHLNWPCFSWVISFNSYTIKKYIYYQAFFF